MAATSTDAEVIEASLDDPHAFGTLFDRHFRPINRYLIRRVGEGVSEDLAAQVFVTAFEIRARYDLTHPHARAWLFGIATNLLRHHLRDERTRLAAYARQATEELHQHGDLEGIEDRVDAHAALPLLIHALSELTPADRDTLLLFAWAELSYPEIAEALAIPIGTVRSRLHRARASMRELISPAAATTE